MTQIIAVINHSTVPDIARGLAAYVKAQNVQFQRDWAPAWKRHREVVVDVQCVESDETSMPAGSWPLRFFDDSDQAGVLGYHEVTNGVPDGKVFARTDVKFGLSPWVTASHEAIELAGDPLGTSVVSTGRGVWYAEEDGDPVEADRYGYLVEGVRLTDFVLPAWYKPKAKGPYDQRGVLSKPLSLAPGGYCQYFTQGSWHQVTAQTVSVADVSRVWVSTRFGRRVAPAEAAEAAEPVIMPVTPGE